MLQENKDSYVFKIPKSRLNAALEPAIVIPNKDCLLLDRGKTLVTCLDRQGRTNVYHMDAHERVVEENPLRMKNEDLGKAFAPLSRQKIQQIGHLKPEPEPMPDVPGLSAEQEKTAQILERGFIEKTEYF